MHDVHRVDFFTCWCDHTRDASPHGVAGVAFSSVSLSLRVLVCFCRHFLPLLYYFFPLLL
jgi:hypothetical protein